MGIQSFDFFRKLSTENEQSSKTGGLLTLLAIIIATILAINETRLYFSRTIKFETTIDNDNLRVINIYLDIIVSAPCQVLSLDTADEVGRHRLDVGDTLQKKRMDKNNKLIKDPFGKDINNYKGSQKELDDVIQAINDQEKCQFEGYFEVNKIPGNFHISYHAQHVLMQKLYSKDIEAYKKMKLDHTIKNLAYGDYSEKFQSVLKKYPKEFKEFIQPWQQVKKNSQANQKADYEYHLNILPTRFYDQGIKQSRTYYKFSINEAQMVKSLNEPDGIWFRHKFSPVNMVYEFEKKSFYHFLVQLFAICGGVFAIFGVLNSFIQKK